MAVTCDMSLRLDPSYAKSFIEISSWAVCVTRWNFDSILLWFTINLLPSYLFRLAGSTDIAVPDLDLTPNYLFHIVKLAMCDIFFSLVTQLRDHPKNG